ncbi:MAG: tryptophan 7-halogenase [Fluviibacter sp.]
MIRKIVIFGGGTSGWLTAAFFVKNLIHQPEIVLIEDNKLGPIGVGEGTQPATARFLHDCGIPPEKWMKSSNASFKLGVELVGWNDDPYFVDNDTFQNHLISDGFFTSEYFANKPHEDFVNWHPSYQLAKANKSPKMDIDHDFNFNLPVGNYGAVHFAAFDIISTIKEHILDKITYVDTRIETVEQSDMGISALISEDGIRYTADLFVDCTGFRSILLNELSVPFHSYDEWLPCDRAVAMPTSYTDPVAECFPYTRATTMNSGWRWTIPIYNRVGNGYVYSSKFISDDQAEHELRTAINEWDAPANRLKMRCGRADMVAVKNVCAIGLSAGFVEPLEATGITFTTAIVRNLANAINNTTTSALTRMSRTLLNQSFYEMVTEIVAFVWAHYHYSSRCNTPFWKSIREQSYNDLPEDIRFFLDRHSTMPAKDMFATPRSMFNTVHWFSVLHAGGAYKNQQLSSIKEDYGKYFVESQRARFKVATEMFPNIHEFLTEFYAKP